MSSLLSLLGASQAQAPVAPEWPVPESGSLNTIPTYDGSGIVTHPSVVDMGAKWNGFRWWRADTPYPDATNMLENPSIWGSNDRINWAVPDGLTNPIYPWSGSGTWNSDTELNWDPDRQELVCYWRDYRPTPAPATIYMHAATSPDGVAWTQQGSRLALTEAPWMSPTIARDDDGTWRMMVFNHPSGPQVRTAPTSLGPWSAPLPTTGIGAAAYHGDMIRHAGRWWGAWSTSSSGAVVRASTSLDGYTWAAPATLPITGYRPTLLPSLEAGNLDCWTTMPSNGPARYHRIPVSAWPL